MDIIVIGGTVFVIEHITKEEDHAVDYWMINKLDGNDYYVVATGESFPDRVAAFAGLAQLTAA